VSDAVRRPCSDFMDMLRRLINYRIIIIIIIIIDDREHCLQGQSIVMINISASVTAPVDRLSTLKVVLSDRGD